NDSHTLSLHDALPILDEEISGERAERHEVRMREVDLDQHAVDQREAQSNQHIQASEYDAVDRLLRDDRRGHALSSTSARSRKGRSEEHTSELQSRSDL